MKEKVLLYLDFIKLEILHWLTRGTTYYNMDF